MRHRARTLQHLLMLVPVVLGVLTVAFAFLSTLPTADRLAAYYGTAPTNAPWTYDPTIPAGAPGCPYAPPPDPVPGAHSCPNPVYQHDVAALGLNRPAPVQWAVFVGLTLTGHWGTTGAQDLNLPLQVRGAPVATAVGDYLPYTLELAAVALLFTYLLGLALARGIWRHDTGFDRSMASTVSHLPLFLLALLASVGGAVLAASVVGASPVTPWCRTGDPTYFEFGASWPAATCFGGSYPAWLVGGFHSTPSGFPTLDAALHGQGWLAVDTLLRLVLPALLVAEATLGALVPGLRRRLSRTGDRGFAQAARSRGFAEAKIAGAPLRRNLRRAVFAEIAACAGVLVTALIVAEVAFSLEGVGVLWARSGILSWTTTDPDYGVFVGTFLALTLLALGIRAVFDTLAELRAPLDADAEAPPPHRAAPAPGGVDERELVRPVSSAASP